MKKVAVLFAPGFEEVEALAPVDILRRAGFEVTMVGVLPEEDWDVVQDLVDEKNPVTVTGSHHIAVKMDKLLSEVSQETFDAVVLPGGMPGAKHLKESKEVLAFVSRHFENGKSINAICAAPIALHAAGVLEDKQFTCYPGFENEITAGIHTGAFIEKDGTVITGCGPAAAFEFGYAIVDVLGGDSVSLREGMQYHRLAN